MKSIIRTVKEQNALIRGLDHGQVITILDRKVWIESIQEALDISSSGEEKYIPAFVTLLSWNAEGQLQRIKLEDRDLKILANVI